MRIEKRSLPMYIVLNCLTLGIYGFIVSKTMDKEITALCKGDNESPRYTYSTAVLFRGIAGVVGLILGLIFGIISINGNGIIGSFIPDSYKVATVLMMMAFGGLIFSIVFSVFSGIYLNFWWFKQASRLKVNGQRYGLNIKETGTDIFLFYTVAEMILIPVTLVLLVATLAIPALIVFLFSLIDGEAMAVIVSILVFLIAMPLTFFGSELTAGATMAKYFMFKNLNRFADVYRNGAASFDPMAYEYYPSVSNKYPNFIPGMISGNAPMGAAPAANDDMHGGEVSTGVLGTTGTLIGINGSCAGYNFDLTSGEEIIIGKDAKVSMVVIDPAYKEISRKHVGVCYDIIRDQYRVVDYSSNGTWANGKKLIPGQEVYLSHGAELRLANDKNTFRLG